MLLDFTLQQSFPPQAPRLTLRLYVNCAAREATLRGPRSIETVRFIDVDSPDKAARWLERNAPRLAGLAAA
jgi:hypothetical protein